MSMFRHFVMLAVVMFAVVSMASFDLHAQDAPKETLVEIQTNHGNFTIKLFPDKAPKTVENFLGYVDSKFYDNTIFHRVIPNFMVQGGGLTADMRKKETRKPVQNEADNGLSNKIGTIAMARTGDPHSATAQFFVNVKDNYSLDHTSKTNGRTWGYCVFGQVVKGMSVVKEIKLVRTSYKNGRDDLPVETVLIKKAIRVTE